MNRKPLKKGYVVITNLIFFLIISMIVVYGISAPVLSSYKIGKSFLESKTAFILANSASEEALYKLKNEMILASSENLILASGAASIETTGAENEKTISIVATTGDYERNLYIKIAKRVSAGFSYGVLTGQGGLDFSGGATVNGNVYANGEINGSGDTIVNGNVVSAPSNTSNSYISDLIVNSGFAWANEIASAIVGGEIYCQTGTGNNKSCNTSRTTPDTQPLPISSNNILEWKTIAETGGIISGNQIIDEENTLSIGPTKIAGDLTVTDNAVLTLVDTVWVTGKIYIAGNGVIKLGTNYGSNSGILIADGKIEVADGASMSGSGTSGSQILAITTNACPNAPGCGSTYAIKAAGHTETVILNAQNGSIFLTGGATAKQASANKVIMNGGATIDYESSIADMEFSSGSAGSWNLISWDEVE